MGRISRIYYKNAVYHICIRGNNRQMILKEEIDKIGFLATLDKFKMRFRFKLFGLVVMDNHVHLVIETSNTLANISKIMQAITLSYSQKFRRKYNYTGYVWQGRFKSSVIEDDSYILGCLNYIHNNPIRANIVENITDYKWSSYHFYNSGINSLEGSLQIDNFIV